jgi:hypothetical protein
LLINNSNTPAAKVLLVATDCPEKQALVAPIAKKDTMAIVKKLFANCINTLVPPFFEKLKKTVRPSDAAFNSHLAFYTRSIFIVVL